MIKKIIAALLCIVCAFGMCSCKKNKYGLVKGKSKIALITDVLELEEDYLNAEIWQGITSFADSNKITYDYYTPEESTVESIYCVCEKAINDGADMLVCMGSAFSGAIAKVQENYPEERIIAIDVPVSGIGALGPQTHCITFKQEEAGYLAGYAAVKDGFTKLGFFAEYDVDRYSSYGYGYFNGISDATKEVGISVDVYFGYGNEFATFDDASAEINKWFDEGCEILMVAGSDNIVKQCASLAVDKCQYVIGTTIDQSYLGQNFDYNPFMTSAMKGLSEAVNSTLEQAASGKWASELAGQENEISLSSGNYLYLNEDEWLWLFEEFTMEDYNTVKDGIARGEIVISGEDFAQYDTDHITLHRVNQQ